MRLSSRCGEEAVGRTISKLRRQGSTENRVNGLGDCPRFTTEEERALHGVMRHGATAEERRVARESLIASMVPWTVDVVTRIRAPAWLDRDDLLSEALLHLTRTVGKFDPDRGRLTTLVGHSVWRWSIRHVRSECRRRRATLNGAADQVDLLRRLKPGRRERALDQPPMDPGEAAALLPRLPPSLRVAVERCLMGGERLDDVAAELGISKQAVSQRVQRGVQELRRLVGAAR